MGLPGSTVPPVAARPTPRTARGVGWRQRESLAAMAFLAPAALGFGAFFLWPTLRALYLSLTDWDLLSPPTLIGFGNYVRLAQDPLFWNALGVTAEYVVLNIGSQTILALGLAVLLHRLTRSMVIRSIVLLPYLIPNVVVALIFLWMLDFNLGVSNEVLEWLGVGRIPFLSSEAWAIPTIAGINTWRYLGHTALLIFAGLQAIPRDVYEAAAIDGASEWRIFTRITVPLLRPVLALVLVLTMIGSFQIFDTVAVTTRGGPENATRVLYYYVFERAFNQYDFGYAAAICTVLMVILAAITFVQLRLMRANQSDLS